MIDGINVYSYVLANPTNRYDKMGLRITDTISGHDSYNPSRWKDFECCKRWDDPAWKKQGYSSWRACFKDKLADPINAIDDVTDDWGTIVVTGGGIIATGAGIIATGSTIGSAGTVGGVIGAGIAAYALGQCLAMKCLEPVT